MRKRNFGSPGRTSAESRSSDLCQLRQRESAEAELHIFGSQGRVEVRKQNFTFLAVKEERKCGRGISDLWQSRQSGSAVAEHQVFSCQGRAEVWKRKIIFSRQDRAEVRKQNRRSVTVQSSSTCGSRT